MTTAALDRREEPTTRTPRAHRPGFLAVALGVLALSAGTVIVASLVRSDGHLVYILDDAAIHLSIAHQLVRHGTWGVQPGVYTSASSAPGWTLLLAGLTAVAPPLANVLPLLLNLAASVWILWLFARAQSFLAPRERDWLTWLVIAFTVPVVLFLPAMSMVGMEHLLHAALVVKMLFLLRRFEGTRLGARDVGWFLLATFAAGTVRFETLFVAAGCCVAVLVRMVPGWVRRLGPPGWSLPAAVRFSAATMLAAGAGLAGYGLVNRAFGEGFLPNTVAAKAAIGHRGLFRAPFAVLRAVESDPLLVLFGLVAIGYLVLAGALHRRRELLPAVAFPVLLVFHGLYGDTGYYDRYTTYLVVAGAFVAVCIADELVPVSRRTPALAFALAALIALTPGRMDLLWNAPTGASNTYHQRYQLARFFQREYRDQPVATGELGYVSLLHRGPVVDYLGLGTYAVRTELRRAHGKLPKDFVARLTRDHGVRAIGIYPLTLFVAAKPSTWYLAGRWTLHEHQASAFASSLEFYAPTEALGRDLDRRLRRFAPSLPAHVTYENHDQITRRLFRALANQ